MVHRDDARYATYSVFWTDYSLGRKEPLKTETRIAETPDRLAELVADYRAEATKRGWSRSFSTGRKVSAPPEKTPPSHARERRATDRNAGVPSPVQAGRPYA